MARERFTSGAYLPDASAVTRGFYSNFDGVTDRLARSRAERAFRSGDVNGAADELQFREPEYATHLRAYADRRRLDADAKAKAESDAGYARTVAGAIDSGDTDAIRPLAVARGDVDTVQSLAKSRGETVRERVRNATLQAALDAEDITDLESYQAWRARYPSLPAIGATPEYSAWDPRIAEATRRRTAAAAAAMGLDLPKPVERPKLERADLGDRHVLYDPTTGQPVQEFRAGAAPRAPGEGRAGGAWRTLTPAELEAAGYPSGSVVQENEATGQQVVRNRPGVSKFTEGERLAAGFSARMGAALQNLETLEASGNVDWGYVWSPDFAAAAGGVFASEESKRARREVRDFINAQLRRESGAAIGDDEFSSARKQYFPVPGDGPRERAAKAAAARLVQQSMAFSGGAATQALMEELGRAEELGLAPGDWTDDFVRDPQTGKLVRAR